MLDAGAGQADCKTSNPQREVPFSPTPKGRGEKGTNHIPNPAELGRFDVGREGLYSYARSFAARVARENA